MDNGLSKDLETAGKITDSWMGRAVKYKEMDSDIASALKAERDRVIDEGNRLVRAGNHREGSCREWEKALKRWSDFKKSMGG